MATALNSHLAGTADAPASTVGLAKEKQGGLFACLNHLSSEECTHAYTHIHKKAYQPFTQALVTTNIATPAPANISGTILAWLSVVGAVLVLMILVLVLVSMWQSGFTIVETNQVRQLSECVLVFE